MSLDYLDRLALDPSRTDGAGERTFRLGLFTQILAACVHDTRCLEVMGLRLLVLCARVLPGSVMRVKASVRRQMQAAEGSAFQMMRVNADGVDLEERMRVAELLLGTGAHGIQHPGSLGRRVTLLAYAFCREPEVRAALPSFEVIGRDIWRLRATNPRSAVCAAMKKAVTEMVARGQLREKDAQALTDMWWAKKKATKAKYARAQMGNTNRTLHPAEDDLPESRREELMQEHRDRIDGVPREAMRPQFRTMTADEIRRHFQRLEAEAEKRRLGL